MIQIKINQAEYSIHEASEDWIREQLNKRLQDDQKICFQVIITKEDLDMILSTPDCPSGGRGRKPNAKELEIFELWNQEGVSRGHLAIDPILKALRKIQEKL